MKDPFYADDWIRKALLELRNDQIYETYIKPIDDKNKTEIYPAYINGVSRFIDKNQPKRDTSNLPTSEQIKDIFYGNEVNEDM